MKPFQLQLKITARLNRNPLNLLAVLSLFFFTDEYRRTGSGRGARLQNRSGQYLAP